MADVFFADETGTLREDPEAVDGPRLEALAHYVLAAEMVGARSVVSVIAVDPDTIAEFNTRFLAGEGPTDVLAFPIDDPADEPDGDYPVILGDVFVCPAVARAQALEDNVAVACELDLLVVHGLLHLLGYDHDTDADAERMGVRERELLGGFTVHARGRA